MKKMMNYHELTKQTIGRLRELAGQYDDLDGVTGMSKETLVDVLAKKLNIDVPHKMVVGVDKSALKGRIRELRNVRAEALAAKDQKRLRRVRQALHRLRHQLRRAIKVTT